MIAFVLGWRPESRRVLAFTPFSEPHHRGVVEAMRGLPIEAIARTGKELAFRHDGKKLQATKGSAVPASMLTSIERLAHVARADMAQVVQRFTLVDFGAIAKDAARVFAGHEAEAEELVRRKGENFEPIVIEVDPGSPLVQFVTHDTADVEREESGDRLEKAVYSFPGLPSARIVWDDDKGVVVTIPGVPASNPLAGWKEIEQLNVRAFLLKLQGELAAM